MKVMYIQYAGDFASAYKKLIVNKNQETYYGQRYSVDAVVEQARNNINVMILVLAGRVHFEKLNENLVSVGFNPEQNDYYKAIKKQIKDFSPDQVILRTPNHKLLKFLRLNKIRTLPVLADSFEKKPLWKVRSRVHLHLVSKELRSRSISWVANHQLNAAKSLTKLGVDEEKILPYDWEHSDSPVNWRKSIPTEFKSKGISLFYAGALVKEKGIYEIINAAKILKLKKQKFTLKIAGNGELESLQNLAIKLDIDEHIDFLGLISHDLVLKNMNTADIVVVPSHHSYTEGLPMTIMESLMVHTPVIASDHPMFVGRVGLRGAVQFFKEKDAKDLAEKIMLTCQCQRKYQAMSDNASLEWSDLHLRLKWADLINCWISDPDHDFSDSRLDKVSS
jgi:glycosyltransferase involved in cell wall biosynthesis